MKSFIKKFSFVLAAAMVLTSVAVPASAEAATKGEVTVKGSAVSSKTVWAGGKSVNFDYKYGKKTSGIKGVWTSNNANIVVNPTSGKVTATGKADGTVTFTPDSKKYKKITVAVKARVRATGLFVREDDKNGQVVSEASVKVGETKKFYVSMSTKLHVKSTYFTHVSASTTAASVTNGANGTSYAGANYGRELTVTGLATGTSVINVSATPYTDDRTSNYDPTPVTLTVKVGETKVDNAFEQGAKQTGAKQITATGLATTAGLFIVNETAPNVVNRVDNSKVTANADGSYNVVYNMVSRLADSNKYAIKNVKGESVASFVATGEKPVDVVIDDTLKISAADTSKAVGTVTVLNQWGENYTDALGVNAVRLTFTDSKDAGEASSTSRYSLDKTAEGVYNFTVNAATDLGAVFKDGDVKKVTVYANDTKGWNKTVSKYLVVNGTEKIASYTLFEDGFYTAAGKVANEDLLTKLDASAKDLTWEGYLAFPKGTKADDFTGKGAFVAYLIDSTASTTTKLAAPAESLANKLTVNDEAGKENEIVVTVPVNEVALTAGHVYSVQVVYNGANGSISKTSKTFKVVKDVKKIEAAVENIVKVAATSELTIKADFSVDSADAGRPLDSKGKTQNVAEVKDASGSLIAELTVVNEYVDANTTRITAVKAVAEGWTASMDGNNAVLNYKDKHVTLAVDDSAAGKIKGTVVTDPFTENRTIDAIGTTITLHKFDGGKVTSTIETPDGTITVIQTDADNSAWAAGSVKFVKADKTEVTDEEETTQDNKETKVFTVNGHKYTVTGSANEAPTIAAIAVQ